jgi:uncharacterized DUF497 family protein
MEYRLGVGWIWKSGRIIRAEPFDHGDPRYRAYGSIDGVAYCLVFTIRNERYRPISLRRAHAKEMRRYAPES